MSRNLNARSVKPMLEQLEDRVTPTVLLGNSQVVSAMVTGLNNVLSDMKTAQNNLATDFNNSKAALASTQFTPTPPNGDNVRLWSHPFGKAVADYQQILSDQAAIHQMVTTDQAVLKGVAFAELIDGDPIDFFILTFFPNSSFNSASQLTTIQNQADSIKNDTTVQNEVNFTFVLRAGSMAPLDNITIAQEVNTPTFGQ